MLAMRTDRPKQQWSNNSPRTSGETETGKSIYPVKGYSGRDQLFLRISLIQTPGQQMMIGDWVGIKQWEWCMRSTHQHCCCLCMWIFPTSVQVKSRWVNEIAVPSLQQLLYVSLVRLNRPWYQRSHREEPCESRCTCKSFTCLLWHMSPTNTPPTAPGMQNCREAEGIIFILQ